MRTELFMYFVLLRITLGPRMQFVDSSAYATDRSKAVVSVLFLFCVASWFILRGASCF